MVMAIQALSGSGLFMLYLWHIGGKLKKTAHLTQLFLWALN